MESQDNPSDGNGFMPTDGEHILERLRDSARRIEQAQQTLQEVSRSIENTRFAMYGNEPGSDAPGARLRRQFGARAEAMLERVVFELIGIPAHATHPNPQAPPTTPHSGAPRRPGRYRQLV